MDSNGIMFYQSALRVGMVISTLAGLVYDST